MKRFGPLAVFIALVLALSWRLAHPSGTAVYSQLVDRPVPALTLPDAAPGQPPITAAAFATGKPQLVNLFGSWCVPCIAEAPQLKHLQSEGVRIIGIAVRDRPEAVAAFLGENGNPYASIGLDRGSDAQVALGSSGVPETFVVDGRGVIRRQFIGGIDEGALPEVRRALAEAAR
ncbi:MAG: redoxin family protein [Sphingomicrobium sp.]|nr:redoxin family protein [Sphingomonadales bacterium]